jgi:prepilin-type N-terminal cleavage/methylation domain-containing protein
MSRGPDVRARAGFTLVELLITVALTGLILAIAYGVLIGQERLARQQHAMTATQHNLRTTLAVLGSELRESSATAGDVVAAGPTHIDFRALRNAGFVCNRDAGGLWIDVVELGAAFAAGDSLLLFHDGANPALGADDVWVNARVASVGTASCAANSASPRMRRLNLAEPVATGIWSGAPVRSFVRVRYSYGAGTGGGVLFRREGATDSVPLVLGLRAPPSGFRMSYRDSAGTAIPPATLSQRLLEIARIDVHVAGSAPGAGGTDRPYTDSIASSIHLRGNRKLP